MLLLALTVVPGGQPASAAASDCSADKHCVYIPAVINRFPAGDLILSGVEVTQSIQDTHNSVPLVAERRTVIRIYARVAGTTEPLSNVEILVTANTAGTALYSSPAAMTSTLPTNNNRADFNTTINYDLPTSWLKGVVDLTIRLDPANKIIEPDETNNEVHLRLTFNPVPPLQIKIVPIQYTHSNGLVYPAPKTDPISDWISRIYPINRLDISWHAAYPFTGDLSSADGWYTLLDQITALKSTEGAPDSQVYYALVPVSNGSSTWFDGGVAGIGWVGSRTSVGLNTVNSAGQVAAHEIGHNLGLWHSPCGTSSSVDQNFPYSDGTIGQYGLDVSNGTVYSPIYRDVMSYCTPKWVSDYTYKKLYDAQVKYGTSAQQMQVFSEGSPQSSLLVRYRFDPNGIHLLPAYVLPGPPQASPAPGDFTVQVLGARDELLSEAKVRAYSMGLDGAERSAIHAVIPFTDKPAAKLRLLKDGRVLAEQPLHIDQSPVAGRPVMTGDGSTARIQWDEADRPSLVRYTTDGGQSWTILGVDVAGGQLQFDTAALPSSDVRFEVIPASAWK